MKNFTIAMSDEMYRDLHRIARQHNVTRAELTRRLLSEFLSEQTGNVYPVLRWGGYRVPRKPRRARRVRQQQQQS
jgi:predicted transcriptional regulator